MKTKGEALADFLEERGVRLNRTRMGWQKVHCYGAGHTRGDRNPSASVNIDKGKYHCFACDLAGDVIDLLQTEDNTLKYTDCLTTLGLTETAKSEDQETWL